MYTRLQGTPHAMSEFNKKHASFLTRNQMIADRLPREKSWVLDVGSNTGFTTKFIADQGHYALGIELMEAEFRTAMNIQKGTAAYMNTMASPEFFRNSPHWDAVLLLSVLHRIYATEGQETMEATLAECSQKTDNLFVECSTSQKRYTDNASPKPGFDHLNVDQAGAWNEEIFARVCGDGWAVQSKDVLPHTKREPFRILYHLKKKSTIA